ncbi:hypothetical protein KC19_VG166000 [Ceratodon purpureus]|uniref:Uncharacterized protein n=1 Tax=Ceratodon purpureus TaxID=3225 RepID=A0A8T0HQU4_CERPU|nr:hypothetical protein KC19_VG166000 [Ceratodon purpureus]
MAESNVKIADSTPEVEKKTESVPDAVIEPTPVSTADSAPESKVEAPEPTEVTTSGEPSAPAPAADPLAPAPVEVSPVAPAQESKEVKALETETLAKPKDLSLAVDTKAFEPASKSDHSTLFQKLKKTFEFPKSYKSKESPSKEAPVAAETTEAVPPAEVPAPAPVAEEAVATVKTSPAPATPEPKPTASEKVAEKVSEGKGFFNKVKKSFYTKSHSFSGSIPESKSGASTATPPPAIAEVSKGAETVPTPAASETSVTPVPEPAVEATPLPAPADVPSSAVETAPTPVAEVATPLTDTVTPAEETKDAPKETVEEKSAVKEEKPKNKFFQKIVRRLLPKNTHNSPPSAAPAAAPVVAASA